MEPSHWAWQRQRPAHHVGALRAYERDADLYELRGPHQTPRGPCDLCAALHDPVSSSSSHNTADMSWYLSSSSSSSSSSDEELMTIMTSNGQLSVIPRTSIHDHRRFKTQGKKSCISLVWSDLHNKTVHHKSTN